MTIHVENFRVPLVAILAAPWGELAAGWSETAGRHYRTAYSGGTPGRFRLSNPKLGHAVQGHQDFRFRGGTGADGARRGWLPAGSDSGSAEPLPATLPVCLAAQRPMAGRSPETGGGQGERTRRRPVTKTSNRWLASTIGICLIPCQSVGGSIHWGMPGFSKWGE